MDMLKESQMVFDVARVRGLYTSLGDGWTYLSAHASRKSPNECRLRWPADSVKRRL